MKIVKLTFILLTTGLLLLSSACRLMAVGSETVVTTETAEQTLDNRIAEPSPTPTVTATPVTTPKPSAEPTKGQEDKNEAAANTPVASPEEIEESTSDSLAEPTDAPTEMPETEAGVDEGDATASPETDVSSTPKPTKKPTEQPDKTDEAETEQTGVEEKGTLVPGIAGLSRLQLWKIAVIGIGVLMVAAVLILYFAMWKTTQENKEAVDAIKNEIGALRRINPEGDKQVKMRLQQLEASLSRVGRARIENGNPVQLLIPTEDNRYLRLKVEEQSGDYVLGTKKTQPVLIPVKIVAAGTHSRGLVQTDKSSGLTVKLKDADSFTGELYFEMESITENYINQNSLDYFFDFMDIPPFPDACRVRVDKPAIVQRDDEGFLLKRKGTIYGVAF